MDNNWKIIFSVTSIPISIDNNRRINSIDFQYRLTTPWVYPWVIKRSYRREREQGVFSHNQESITTIQKPKTDKEFLLFSKLGTLRWEDGDSSQNVASIFITIIPAHWLCQM